jgi:hypothetical protein
MVPARWFFLIHSTLGNACYLPTIHDNLETVFGSAWWQDGSIPSPLAQHALAPAAPAQSLSRPVL